MSKEEVPASVEEDTSFDLIVVGTGLVESIVSCAAAKARKRVLHLDESDTYGGIYMSHSYASLGKLFRANAGSPAVASEESALPMLPQATLYHKVVDEDHLPSSLAKQDTRLNAHPSSWHPSMVQLLKGKSVQVAAESSSRARSGDKDQSRLHPAFLLAEEDPAACIAIHALACDRDFNFSLLPKVLLSTGKYINALLHSGVSRYLEFKTIDSVYFHITQQAAAGSLWKIPCSKSDIFNDRQLSSTEKLALKKFHQSVADWGRAADGTDVKALNEIEMAVGRSLYRPQNKQEMHSHIYKTAGDDDDTPFTKLMSDYKLSPKLQSLIQYGLCFHPGPTTSVYRSGDALRDLSLHINSLGRYSETALLACMYGVSEMVQGFCRMSAVWGSTFVLRRRVAALRPHASEKQWEVVDEEGTVFKAPAVVLAGQVSTVSCKPFMNLAITALCYGQVQSTRSIAVLPPEFMYRDAQSGEMRPLGNQFAIQVLQSDESTAACPAGMSVVTIHTLISDPAAEQDSSLQTWSARAVQVEAQAKDLVQRIRHVVFDNAPQPPVVVKLVAALTPLTNLSLHCLPGDSEVSLAVCGSGASTSLHMEDEVTQAEAIALGVLRLDKLFEEPEDGDRNGEYGEGSAEDDEMHMLNQALALASSTLPAPAVEDEESSTPPAQESCLVQEVVAETATCEENGKE